MIRAGNAKYIHVIIAAPRESFFIRTKSGKNDRKVWLIIYRNIHIYVYTHTLTQFFTSLVDSTFSLLCSFPPALCLSFSLCLWMVSGPSLHPATVEQIVSVFQAASKQKAWDHFSKAQRKNLDMWRKQAEVSILWFRSVRSHDLWGEI